VKPDVADRPPAAVNFNALIHESERSTYARVLRRHARSQWFAYQLGNSFEMFRKTVRITRELQRFGGG